MGGESLSLGSAAPAATGGGLLPSGETCTTTESSGVVMVVGGDSLSSLGSATPPTTGAGLLASGDTCSGGGVGLTMSTLSDVSSSGRFMSMTSSGLVLRHSLCWTDAHYHPVLPHLLVLGTQRA